MAAFTGLPGLLAKYLGHRQGFAKVVKGDRRGTPKGVD
jgi:hypothetical protein